MALLPRLLRTVHTRGAVHFLLPVIAFAIMTGTLLAASGYHAFNSVVTGNSSVAQTAATAAASTNTSAAQPCQQSSTEIQATPCSADSGSGSGSKPKQVTKEESVCKDGETFTVDSNKLITPTPASSARAAGQAPRNCTLFVQTLGGPPFRMTIAPNTNINSQLDSLNTVDKKAAEDRTAANALLAAKLTGDKDKIAAAQDAAENASVAYNDALDAAFKDDQTNPVYTKAVDANTELFNTLSADQSTVSTEFVQKTIQKNTDDLAIANPRAFEGAAVSKMSPDETPADNKVPITQGTKNTTASDIAKTNNGSTFGDEDKKVSPEALASFDKQYPHKIETTDDVQSGKMAQVYNKDIDNLNCLRVRDCATGILGVPVADTNDSAKMAQMQSDLENKIAQEKSNIDIYVAQRESNCAHTYGTTCADAPNLWQRYAPAWLGGGYAIPSVEESNKVIQAADQRLAQVKDEPTLGDSSQAGGIPTNNLATDEYGLPKLPGEAQLDNSPDTTGKKIIVSQDVQDDPDLHTRYIPGKPDSASDVGSQPPKDGSAQAPPSGSTTITTPDSTSQSTNPLVSILGGLLGGNPSQCQPLVAQCQSGQYNQYGNQGSYVMSGCFGTWGCTGTNNGATGYNYGSQNNGTSMACAQARACMQQNQGILPQLLNKLLGNTNGSQPQPGSPAANAACANYPGTTLVNGQCSCPTGQSYYQAGATINGQTASVNGCYSTGANGGRPTATISCATAIADENMVLPISWSCQNAATVRADGFSPTSQELSDMSGSDEVPVQGSATSDTNTYAITCSSQGVNDTKQCVVRVNRPSIVLAKVPDAPRVGDSTNVAWFSTGMQHCDATAQQKQNGVFTDLDDLAASGPAGRIALPAMTDGTQFKVTVTCLTASGLDDVASTTVSQK